LTIGPAARADCIAACTPLDERIERHVRITDPQQACGLAVGHVRRRIADEWSSNEGETAVRQAFEPISAGLFTSIGARAFSRER
jgi:hypothetical protein